MLQLNYSKVLYIFLFFDRIKHFNWGIRIKCNEILNSSDKNKTLKANNKAENLCIFSLGDTRSAK